MVGSVRDLLTVVDSIFNPKKGKEKEDQEIANEIYTYIKELNDLLLQIISLSEQKVFHFSKTLFGVFFF